MTRTCSSLIFALALACDPAPLALDGGARPDAPALPDAGPPADLEGFIEHHMAAGGIPGLAAAVVVPGGVAWSGTFGLADTDTGAPVDEHTLFIMASVSKTVAVIRAMQLVEAGALDLDAPIESYVPYSMRHPDHPDVPITARMLLTHTSGLEDDFVRLAAVTTVGDPTETLAGFSEGYALPGGAYYGDSNWGARPGTRRSYCNAGFGVLGHVLEAAGDASFRDQTRAAVFEPLAMDGAGWFLADVDLARLATPHGYNGHSYRTLEQNGFAYYPASSFRVSLAGLIRYGRALLRGGELDGARVLEESSVAEMLRIQLPGISGAQALAFSDRYVSGHAYVGHGGSTFGGSTQLLLSRDGLHGIILVANSDAYVRARLGLTSGGDAMDAILERLDEEALARR